MRRREQPTQQQQERWSRPRRARWAKLVGVRLSAAQADQVFAIADARSCPIADVLRDAVAYYLSSSRARTAAHLKAAG